MRRNTLLTMLIASAIPSTLAFSFVVKQKTAVRLSKQSHNTRMFAVESTTNSWSKYQHDFIDPKVAHAVESPVDSRVEPSKRKEADEYWKNQYEEAKKKSTHVDNWSHYKNEYIEPKILHEKELKGVKSHIDSQKRESSDKFWKEKYQEDKEKALHHRSHEAEEAVNDDADTTTSFSDYQHDNIDPRVQHFIKSGIEDHMDPVKRKEADEYWKSQYEEEKKKSTHVDNWSHYKNEYVEPKTPHHKELTGVTNHIDPAKRAISDEYWLEKYQEEKAKLHHTVTPPDQDEMDDLSKTSPMDFLP